MTPTPYYHDEAVTIYHGDCFDILKDFPENSINTCITDPPYGLEFMGKEWDKLTWNQESSHKGKERDHGSNVDSHDYGMRICRGINRMIGGVEAQRWHQAWGTELFRVLKPGGMLLAFGGTRTFHRLTCALEDAGFEIRDCLMWLYGQGFPKSLDISKAIDKSAGAEREVIGQKIRGNVEKAKSSAVTMAAAHANRNNKAIFGYGVENLTAPATDAAKQWDGWGTALKPAWEIILVAQKPLIRETEQDTIVANLLQLEAQLWSLLPASIAESHFKLSPQEYDAACAFARWSAEQRRNMWEDLFGQMDTLQSVSVMNTILSIVSSWRSCLVGNYEPMSTSTILERDLKVNQTIDLRTLRSCLLDLTPSTIIKAELQAPGSRLNALAAARYLNAVATSISATRELSVVGSVIEQERILHPDGLGLVPNYEPIILAMKPLEGTFAQNALKHGVSGLNVDGARIGTTDNLDGGAYAKSGIERDDGWGMQRGKAGEYQQPLGRFPANLVLSHLPECEEVGTKRVKGTAAHPVHSRVEKYEGYGNITKKSGEIVNYGDPDGLETVAAWTCADGCPVKMLDEQSGDRKAGGNLSGNEPSRTGGPGTVAYGEFKDRRQWDSYQDSGGASRFFYCAKASRSERGDGNLHPTVKPLALMRWLCRLTKMPKGGVVLDQFMGSGTTGVAAVLEGRQFIGIEQSEQDCEMAVKRIREASRQGALLL